MPLRNILQRNKLYFLAVFCLTVGIYFICDYNLATTSKEIMNSFVESESVSIQEGNLLSSITKTQRFLMSSDYIKGIRLFKLDQDQIRVEYESGRQFSIEPEELRKIDRDISSEYVGLLHRQIFYKIPSKPNMVLVFDVSSDFLILLFGFSTALVVLLISFLIWSLRRIEQKEFEKREEILRLAVNDLISSGETSSILEKEMPHLIKWYKVKKNELVSTQKMAIEQLSQIRLGELAAKAVHDIRGAVRNIRQTAKVASGLNDQQKTIIENAVIKISNISQNLRQSTVDFHSTENLKKDQFDLIQALLHLINEKQIEFGETAIIEFQTNLEKMNLELNLQELLRSIENLINNAVEASNPQQPVIVSVYSETENFIEISITDSGRGISKENINQLGVKGFTYGKTDGTGLGVYSAKRFVEDIGGRFKVVSTFGKGTTVTLEIPTLHIEKQPSHVIASDQHIVILEDQVLIRKTIQYKFNKAGLNPDKYTLLSTPQELENWIATHDIHFRLYSDYFLEDKNGHALENGIEVINRLGLNSKAILFTSAYDNPLVIEAAQKASVPMMSKDEFLDAEVRTM